MADKSKPKILKKKKGEVKRKREKTATMNRPK
jgi:hypothetical protein